MERVVEGKSGLSSIRRISLKTTNFSSTRRDEKPRAKYQNMTQRGAADEQTIKGRGGISISYSGMGRRGQRTLHFSRSGEREENSALNWGRSEN